MTNTLQVSLIIVMVSTFFAVAANGDLDCYGPGTDHEEESCFLFVFCDVVACDCKSTYTGEECDERYCSSSTDCNSHGTTSGTAPCSCTCATPYTGASCDKQLCNKDYHCNGRATGIASGTYYPGCVCSGCAAPYGGNDCGTRLCNKDFDCNNRGTGISGSYPNCICSGCTAPFGGNDCSTRICHKNFDCQGRGLSITGAFPDCNCRCEHGYGGRKCRTLSMTISISVTMSIAVSSSATWVDSNSVSYSLTKSPSTSAQQTPSTTLLSTLSETLTVTVMPSGTATTVATGTRTATPSVSATMAVTQTTTLSSTQSKTASVSHSATYSCSGSMSATMTLTGNETNTLSHESTDTASSTFFVSPSAYTPSLSYSKSLSPTGPSISSSRTVTIPKTESESLTYTCRAFDDLNIWDTCSVLRALPTDWESSATSAEGPSDNEGSNALLLTNSNNISSSFAIPSSWLEATSTDSNCTDIHIPFDRWSGRNGATYTIYFAAVDRRIPLKAALGTEGALQGTDKVSFESAVANSLPISFQFTSIEELQNATRSGILRDPPDRVLLPNDTLAITNYYPTAVATFRYEGKNTLNKVEYSLAMKDWPRCPIPMSAEVRVTLLASERLIPGTLADAVTSGGSAISVFSSLTGSPTAVLQMSVVSSLRKMSRCMDTELDDPADDDSYDGFTSGILNPIHLTVGGGGGRKFIRGALAVSFVYLVTLTFLMLALTTGVQRLATAFPTGSQGGQHSSTASTPSPNRKARVSVMTGYPAALVAVVSFAMDGAASSGTMLAAFGSSAADRAAGGISLALCFLYVGQIFFVTVIRFPSSLTLESIEVLKARKAALTLQQQQPPKQQKEFRNNTSFTLNDSFLLLEQYRGQEREGSRKRRDRWTILLRRFGALLASRTHEWHFENGDKETKDWWERYEEYISDSKLSWYCSLEQTVALIVCVLSSLAFGNMTYCIIRGSAVLALVGAQFLVMAVMRPAMQTWRWALMSFLLALQAASAALSIANAQLQNQQIELGMDVAGSVTFFVLTAISVADVLIILVNVRGMAKRILSFLKEWAAAVCLASKARWKQGSLISRRRTAKEKEHPKDTLLGQMGNDGNNSYTLAQEDGAAPLRTSDEANPTSSIPLRELHTEYEHIDCLPPLQLQPSQADWENSVKGEILRDLDKFEKEMSLLFDEL